MDYDNGFRLKQMKHQIDVLPEQILSYADYNVKNQLVTKRMGKVGSLNYDAVNRMTNAKYSDISASGAVTGGRYDEMLTYDIRGNINTLQRNGLTSVAGASNPTWGQSSGSNDSICK